MKDLCTVVVREPFTRVAKPSSVAGVQMPQAIAEEVANTLHDDGCYPGMDIEVRRVSEVHGFAYKLTYAIRDRRIS